MNGTTLEILTIIQARMSSTRLYGKVLADVGGRSVLERVVERTGRAKTVTNVVVATSDEPSDDPIYSLCHSRNYACFRGNLYDVLDRFYQTAILYNADVVVRITGDCPLIDPELIDEVVEAFLGAQKSKNQNVTFTWDMVTNRLPPPWKRTYPIGLDTEVCSFHALEKAWKNATLPYHREHVMPYLYEPERSVIYSSLNPIPSNENFPSDKIRVLVLDNQNDYGAYRWAVDTVEDLDLMRQVYSYFNNHDDFSWLAVLDLFQQKPELASINAHIKHKSSTDVDHRMNL